MCACLAPHKRQRPKVGHLFWRFLVQLSGRGFPGLADHDFEVERGQEQATPPRDAAAMEVIVTGDLHFADFNSNNGWAL